VTFGTGQRHTGAGCGGCVGPWAFIGGIGRPRRRLERQGVSECNRACQQRDIRHTAAALAIFSACARRHLNPGTLKVERRRARL